MRLSYPQDPKLTTRLQLALLLIAALACVATMLASFVNGHNIGSVEFDLRHIWLIVAIAGGSLAAIAVIWRMGSVARREARTAKTESVQLRRNLAAADAIIRAAGARNVAAKFPDNRHSSYSLEELLVARPGALMRGTDGYEAPSLRDSAAEHPLIRAAYRDRRVTYPDSLYSCGLPQSADAAARLRAALMKTAAGKVPW